MTFGRIVSIFIFSSLVATGAALAGGTSNNGAGIKGDHALAKSGPASIRHAGPEVPIVMGRSVSVHRKTKLHHLKMKPLDSVESADSADASH